MMKFSAPRAVIGAALILAATGATASQSWSTGRVAVSTTGLNLTTAAGRVALDRRVDAAIAAMCGAPVFGTRDEADALRECRIEARAAVTPQVDQMVSRAGVTMASSRP